MEHYGKIQCIESEEVEEDNGDNQEAQKGVDVKMTPGATFISRAQQSSNTPIKDTKDRAHPSPVASQKRNR